MLFLNAGVGVGVISWGFIFWEYGHYGFNFTNEGWFGKNTKEGGMDKFGHMYSTFLMTHLFDALYDRWGFSNEEAANYGFLSSVGINTLMEIGDGLSDYGFSYEDMIVNIIGASMGYLRTRFPEFEEKIDFRLEYVPKLNELNGGDLITDYEHMKFLVAVKASGFKALKEDSFLKYLEFQVGYYSRGYDDFKPEEDHRHRVHFIGIGLNMGKFLESVWKTSLFNYVQPPCTYGRIRYSDR